MSKFKIGDKVKILPSAVENGVARSSVGKIGRVAKLNKEHGYFCVVMDDDGIIQPVNGWVVFPDEVELVVIKGQQLLFSFMNE